MHQIPQVHGPHLRKTLRADSCEIRPHGLPHGLPATPYPLPQPWRWHFLPQPPPPRLPHLLQAWQLRTLLPLLALSFLLGLSLLEEQPPVNKAGLAH